MPRIGLEPTHLAAPEPKSGVSTISPSGQEHLANEGSLGKVCSYRQWFLPD